MHYKLIENVIKSIKLHFKDHPESVLDCTKSQSKLGYFSYRFSCNCGFKIYYIASITLNETHPLWSAHELLTSRDDGYELFIEAIINNEYDAILKN